VKLYTQIIAAIFLTTTSLATLAADVESTSQVIRKTAPKGISESFYTCIDKASSSTIDEASCLASEKSSQDARLNKNYKKLLGALRGDAKTALVASEKAWLDSRSKDGALESLLYGAGPQIDNLQLEQNDIFKLCTRANVLENYQDVVDSTN
jgi:uncharacterized protein YecT (DUF1311 family)